MSDLRNLKIEDGPVSGRSNIVSPKMYDYTSMSTFMTCQRKYDFRMNRGLVGHLPPQAADFGKCIHLALDSWYQDKDVDHAIAIFKDNYVESDEDDKRTHKMGVWILSNYHNKYYDQPFKVLSVEQEFNIPLPNGNQLIGRIDKVIEWDGVIWGVDHKTTSALGPSYMRFHTPNLQFSGYTWALQQLGYKNCAGILVDAILVAKGLIEGKSKSNLTPLARDFAYRSKEDIVEYLQTIMAIQHHIGMYDDLHQQGKNMAYVPNWDACVDYGECPYRKICKEPVEMRERIIASEYRVEHWNPIKKEIKK